MRESTIQTDGVFGRLVLLWGVLGVTLLLGQALIRLTPIALAPWAGEGLSPWQMGVCVVWVGINAYAEGYRAFQLRYCPRVVARGFYVARYGRWWEQALAPVFCMSFFGATRKGLAVAWCLLLGIVLIVIVVHQLPQPWRGIIDAGVVVGLGWGVVCLWFELFRHWRGGSPWPGDLPEERRP